MLELASFSVVFTQYYFTPCLLEQLEQSNLYDRYLHLVDFSSQYNTCALRTRAIPDSSFYPESLNQHQYATGTQSMKVELN